MLDFAEKSDGNEADRTAEGFARMFGNYFPPEFSITEGSAWMSTPVSYTHLDVYKRQLLCPCIAKDCIVF